MSIHSLEYPPMSNDINPRYLPYNTINDPLPSTQSLLLTWYPGSDHDRYGTPLVRSSRTRTGRGRKPSVGRYRQQQANTCSDLTKMDTGSEMGLSASRCFGNGEIRTVKPLFLYLFLQILPKKHSIAHPERWDMECSLWVHCLIYILHVVVTLYVIYCDILLKTVLYAEYMRFISWEIDEFKQTGHNFS